MQGWRKSNEDGHVTAVDFEPGHSIFAVFDGHGGVEVAKFCENHIVN
jgi:protein phosphatase 1G